MRTKSEELHNDLCRIACEVEDIYGVSPTKTTATKILKLVEELHNKWIAEFNG